MKSLLILGSLFLSSSLLANISTTSATTSEVVTSAPINVDGYVKETTPTDHEIETIRAEIQKQKKEIILNKQKAQGFKALAKSTEQLSETTGEYLEERKAAQAEIAEYNLKVRCLQEENPGKECDKFVRRKR